MKTYLLSILITFIVITLSAQSHRFADSSAQWYMTTYENALWCGGCTSYFTTLYTIKGDTAVNGKQYQKINDALVRRDTAQKVYRYFNDSDVIIYDFARNAGDTFTLLNLYGGGMDVSCRVDSVDTVMLNYPRKRMYITYNDNSFWREQWIEGIGSVRSNFLNPGMELMGFDMPSHGLRCFYEEDSLLLHTDTVDTRCDIDTFIPPPPPYYWFADSSAQWNVLSVYVCMTTPCSYWHTEVYRFANDTIISNKWYQHIFRPGSNDVFIRQDFSHRIYALPNDSAVEKLLYDFSLNVGETARLYNASGYGPWSSAVCHVDSIDTVFIGKPRKRFYVRLEVQHQWYRQDVIIEGIGSLYTHFLSPGNDPQALDGNKEDLLCFFENDSQLLHRTVLLSDSISCLLNGQWVGINEVELISANISPNPANNDFLITLSSQPETATLIIHDALGRVVKREELVSTTQQISVVDLPNGMYTYSVMQNSARQASGKLVIAK